VDQARSQVLRFGGAKYIFRGHDFCVYCIFKTNFSGNKKIWGSQKKFGGTAPECLRVYGPVVDPVQWPLGLFHLSLQPWLKPLVTTLIIAMQNKKCKKEDILTFLNVLGDFSFLMKIVDM